MCCDLHTPVISMLLLVFNHIPAFRATSFINGHVVVCCMVFCTFIDWSIAEKLFPAFPLSNKAVKPDTFVHISWRTFLSLKE